MIRRVLDLPLLVILMGAAAVMMLVPMAHAVRIADFFTARVFLQCGLLFFLLTALVGLASVNYQPRLTARSHLTALLIAFLALPLVLAAPLRFLVPDTTYLQLYFEMVACLTTTGATFFDDPARLSEPIHLWRAFVGWMGGLLILISAISIFAPLNLGGFEVYSAAPRANTGGMSRIRAADMSERLINFTLMITPIYIFVTGVLALILIILGERAFVAVVVAFSTVSTSGITEGTGLGTGDAPGGFYSEAVVFVFLLLAVSRLFYISDRNVAMLRNIPKEPEFRLMLVIVIGLPALLFLRHWFAAFDVNEQSNFEEGISALWAGVFMTLSFLTTTGFESGYWQDAQNWSGLSTPGLIFLGVAVAGGGVATTAGGVKLLRVYALYRHGILEMQKLSYPSAVGRRSIRKGLSIGPEGAYIAWLFFMLFATSTAVTMLALTIFGLEFDQALVLAISALSTTGPLADVVAGSSGSYAILSDAPRAVLALAMVVGRLETLAIVALLNPEFWRQ